MSDLLDQMDSEKADRFLMAVFGLMDYHFPADLPKEIVVNGIKHSLVDYNFLEDRIDSTYEKETTRWYENEEKAKLWGWDYKTSKSEGYEYESVRVCTYHKTFYLSEWKKYANNEK
jgi:hypothetical protein